MSSDINSIFSFPGTGMDTDSDLVTIQSGDSRYRRNIVVSDDGNHNVLTNSLGNTLKTNLGLPVTGTNKIVGVVEDKEVDAIIFCNYNSGGDHGIYIYYSATDTFDLLISAAWLNFQVDRVIDMGVIGNQDDRYLILTDGYNPIRNFNIESILANPFTTGDEASSFYKRPFTGNISAVYADYSSYDGNDLKGKSFQFSIRLKYYDKSYSTISPFSAIPLPISENMPNGRLTNEVGNNVIYVSISMDHDTDSVTSYQLLYRIIDIGSGAAGSWSIYKDIDYASIGLQATIPFLNDTSIGIVSKEEADRPYDYVPDKADHIGIIDANRAVFGGITEGFNNVDMESPSASTVTVTPNIFAAGNEGIVYQNSVTLVDTTTQSVNFVVADTVNDDYYYYLYISTSSNEETLEHYSSFNSTSYDVFAEMITSIDAFLSDGSSLTELTGSRPNSTTLTVTLDTGGRNHTLRFFVLKKTNTYNTLKTGARYKLGFRYGYGGKVGFVQTTDTLIFPTPAYSEIVGTNYSNYTLEAVVNINHTAPIGATDFQIVSFGSNIFDYEEYVVYCNNNDVTDSDIRFTIYLDGPDTVIRRDDIVNRFRSAYNNGIEYGLDYEVGDIVRFLGYFDPLSSPIANIKYDVNDFPGIYEYRINSISSTEIRLSSSAIKSIEGYIDVPVIDFGSILIQIVKLKPSFNTLAQEFSSVYPISAHTGTINITTLFADCWKSKQVYINSNNYTDYGLFEFDASHYSWMEKSRISLYYNSNPSQFGRFNFVNDLSESKYYSKIRWGGKFIDDAGVNFMSRFEYNDEKFLDDRNGSITVINQVGDTLKVYQERKSNSLYLKTTSSDDPNGTSTFVFSEAVMSDPRQSVVDYGCTHFTSYVRDVRNSFFFDLGNKSALIDTPGGIMSITDGAYKMHTYFSQKSAAIVLFGKDLVEIHGTYDDDLDMYVLSFIVPSDLSDDINDTVAYHVPSKRWITHFPLPTDNPVEYYGRLTGKTMVSFYESQLYLHNSNQTRNNFWGTQYDSEVWIHANESPVANKTYDSIEINSVGQWSCPDNDSIEITKPSLMRSRLVAGKFKIQEGIFRSEFLRNALNKALAFIRHLLLNGQILRGREMTIKLKNTDTTEAQLETVVVKSTISK